MGEPQHARGSSRWRRVGIVLAMVGGLGTVLTIGAEGPLGRWLEARPEAAEAHLLRARVALAQGQPEGAVEALATAERLGLAPERLDPVRGLLLAAAGRYDEAEPLLRRALERDPEPAPELAEALARLGLATFRLGTALEGIERWRRDAPDDPEPYLRRLEVHRRTGATPEVLIDDAREALRRDPASAEARLALADALRDAGRHAEAAEAYNDALAQRPDDPAVLTGAGRNAQALGQTDEAVRLLDRALTLDPEYVPALFERAGLDLARGDSPAALGRLDAALRIEPDDPEIRYRRALTLAQLGRADEAQRERAATEQARRDNARLTELRDRLVRHPQDVQVQLDIARWMIDHGHDEEGLRWAEKILREQPGHAETSRHLVDYYERRGEHGRANFYRVRAGLPR